MRNYFFLLLLLISMFSACSSGGSNSDRNADERSHRGDTGRTAREAEAATADRELLELSENILKLLKAGNYQQLAQYIHPREGLRFSPYSYVDTLENLKFSSSEFTALNTSKKLLWGHYDGSGTPISLTLDEYFDKFVYDADFMTAPEKAVNTILGQGNTVNNIKDVYPGSHFTEFYFPGTDPRYGGMDWRSLRLVFKKAGDEFYLVGIVHDQWTI